MDFVAETPEGLAGFGGMCDDVNFAMIEKRSEENRKAMEHYRAEKNLEFYKTARDLWDRDCEILIDAQCALDARLGDNK